jgi:hypothetical protein
MEKTKAEKNVFIINLYAVIFVIVKEIENKLCKTNNQLSSQIIQHTVKPALRGHDLWYKEKVAL